MLLAFKYRLLPTKAQRRALEEILESQRILYNAALEERIGCYRRTGRTVTYAQQCAGLTIWRRDDVSAAGMPPNLQRWTLRRVDAAYCAFFRRLGTRRRGAGFPRFRGRSAWNSFGFNEFSGIRFDGKRLRWKGLPGGLRVHLHRSLPNGALLKGCVFSRDSGGWVVSLQIKVATPDKAPILRGVGIDLGIGTFAYLSDGTTVMNPRLAQCGHREMRKRQRALSRGRIGSRRRDKTRARVVAQHRAIANSRATWLHQQSAKIVRKYDLIAVEDLSVKGLARGMLAAQVNDASWGTFLSMLSYKAERAGATLVKVPAKNTSQRCSGCGELVRKSLGVRTHSCPHCGLVIDRDWNAAKNILRAAVASRGELNVAQWGERALGNLGGAETLPENPRAEATCDGT